MLYNSKNSKLKHEKEKRYSKLDVFGIRIVHNSNVLSWFQKKRFQQSNSRSKNSRVNQPY